MKISGHNIVLFKIQNKSFIIIIIIITKMDVRAQSPPVIKWSREPIDMNNKKC